MSVNRIIISVAALIILSGCGGEEEMRINGNLIGTTGGQHIYFIGLENRDFRIRDIYRSQLSVGQIDNISKVSDDAFLFGEGHSDRAVMKYDIKAGKAERLWSGRLPTYVPKYDKVLYYDTAEDSRQWLFISDLKGKEERKKIAEAPDPVNGISVTKAPIPVSDGEVIFMGKSNQIWRYRISDSRCVPTGIKNYRPEVLRSVSGGVICREISTWELYEADLNTKEMKHLPKLKGTHGYVYIPEADSLLYSKTRFSFFYGEADDIHLYSFGKEKSVKIMSGRISSGILIRSPLKDFRSLH